MAFDNNDDQDSMQEMYAKALETHVAHGDHWGVPPHVLRRSMVEEGIHFNKLAWLMHLIMGELSRPETERSEWIL